MKRRSTKFAHAESFLPEQMAQLEKISTNGYFTIPKTESVWAGIAGHSLSPFQVGTLVGWMEQGWRNPCLLWWPAAYAAYPQAISDGERVVVVDFAGNTRADKLFAEYTFDEILALAAGHLWCRPEMTPDLQLSDRFSRAELDRLDALRTGDGWRLELAAAAASLSQSSHLPKALQGRPPVLLHIQQLVDPSKTRIVTRSYIEDKHGGFAKLKELSDHEGWLLDPKEDWTVCDLTGKVVAKKRFDKFTHAEVEKYWIGHFWFNLKV